MELLIVIIISIVVVVLGMFATTIALEYINIKYNKNKEAKRVIKEAKEIIEKENNTNKRV